MSRAAYHTAALNFASDLGLEKNELKIVWPKGSRSEWRAYASELAVEKYSRESKERAAKRRFYRSEARITIPKRNYEEMKRREYGAYVIAPYILRKGPQGDHIDFFANILETWNRRARSAKVAEKAPIGVDIIFRQPRYDYRLGKTIPGDEIRRHISFLSEDKTEKTAEEMANEAEELASGETQNGSDALPSTSQIDESQFYITYFLPLAAQARSVFSKTENEYYHFKDPGSKGYCLISCLRAISQEKVPKQARSIARELGYEANEALPLEALDRLSEIYNVSIPIWDGDSVEEVKRFTDTISSGNTCSVTRKPKVLREAVPGKNEPQEGMAIALTTDSEGAPHYVLITSTKEGSYHEVTGDAIKEGDKKQKDLAVAERLIEQKRPLLGRYKELERKIKKVDKKPLKDLILLYDLETVFDPYSGDLEAYAAAWMVVDPEDTEEDFSRRKSEVRIEVASEENREPIAKLADFILQCPSDSRYVLEAYNGSSFDHMILSRALCKKDHAPTNICYFAGKLISGNVGRHSFHDLCRFVAASLKAACEGFGTIPKKVEGFEHTEPQAAFLEGNTAWMAWLAKNDDKLQDYCKTDVLCLGSLFVKARKAFKQLTEGGDILSYSTIAQLSYDRWRKTLRSLSPSNQPIAASSREEDQFIRRAYTAGRVEILGNKGKPYSIEGNPVMYDYKSLYPTVCTVQGNDFPTGRSRKARKGELQDCNSAKKESFLNVKLGIYSCCVLSQEGINVVPKRGKEKLDWKYKRSFLATLTSVDISEIRRNGGRVHVQDGYVWDKSSKEMFAAYFEPLAAEKQRQDALKKAKSPDYNAPLREVCKLLMNALTGKVGQRERTKSTVVARGAKAMHAFLEKHENITTIPLYGETVIMTGEPKEEKEWRQGSAKPSYIAAFIYSYARRSLYKLLPYSEYCDTDSGLMTEENGRKFREEHPELFPEIGKQAEFGHVEEELTAKKKSHSYKAYFVQPKLYAVFARDEKGEYDCVLGKKGEKEGLSKIRSKGVKGSDIVLDKIETELVRNASSPGELFGLHTKGTKNGSCFREEANAEKVMQLMCAGEEVNVLCSQLTRSLGSKDGKSYFSVTQRYLLKELGAKKTAQSTQRTPQKERPDNLAQ